MRTTRNTLCLLLTLTVAADWAGVARADDPVWKPIMDGQTLAGWHENGEGQWTVEDGAFVGRSSKAKLYGHLVSDDEYQDFTVRFKFQCTSGDSGFFIRTKMQEPDKTLGLQIQVGPCGSGTGGIYESYGRGWLQQPTLEQEQSCYREGKWNEMIISAHGPRVSVYVNGVKTADLNDDKINRQAGVFALQMHSGVVNHTMFQDLAILDKGEIVPRPFLYHAAQPVEAGDDGSLSLHASGGIGTGEEIRYLPEWGAFGWFSDKDQIQWPVQIQRAGTFDVWLEWSAADESAGKAFVLSIGDAQLSGDVATTGSWTTFKKAKIGQLKLKAGAQRAVFKPAEEFSNSLLGLREIKLVPADASGAN